MACGRLTAIRLAISLGLTGLQASATWAEPNGPNGANSPTVVRQNPSPPRAKGANAAAQSRARTLYQRGLRLFRIGQFDAALRAYQSGFAAAPLPGFLFNIAQCYRNLGELERASESFQEYLRLQPNAVNRMAVERLLRSLDRGLKARRQPTLLIPPHGPQRPERLAIYQHWGFWTSVAAAAVVGGTAVYFQTRGDGIPAADGRLDFGK
jgi:tetratricopeptide (TPR) repeat protein